MKREVFAMCLSYVDLGKYVCEAMRGIFVKREQKGICKEKKRG